MSKIKRETLKKFGCHEKQVEELMLELGHTVDDSDVPIDLKLLTFVGRTLCYGNYMLFDFLPNGTVRRIGSLPSGRRRDCPFIVDAAGKVVMSD